MDRVVLIITQPCDIHAHAVAWGLHQCGKKSVRWYPSDLAPVPALIRMQSQNAPVVELNGPDGAFTCEALHSVWLRRFSAPQIPESLPFGDRQVAQREMLAFLHGTLQLIGPQAFWANSLRGHRVASLKMPQLAAAFRVGLPIPDTVLSNAAEPVCDFIDHASGRVIYKPFYPAVWKGDEKNHTTITAVVTRDDLSNPETLQHCPGIFQTFIPKAYELRVTIFGRTCIAAKISNQDEIDWRHTHKMTLEPYILPEAIQIKLFQLMDVLGIVMGTLDLIVTEKGEYVFLEVNEQGQFLWIEQMNPDIRLLEPFTQFLIAADPGFRWIPNAESPISFHQYLASEAYLLFQHETKQYSQRNMKNTIVVNDP